jgi:outer membrane protein assembly factor BamA
MPRMLPVWIVLLCGIQAQAVPFPLESVSVEGTSVSKDVVLELAGLKIGSLVDKTAFDAAAQKLNDTGLFESIGYRYAPGPHKGYALILNLADPKSLSSASIDIPGANEDETWRWLASRYPALIHKIPANDAGQQFVASKLEEHLGPPLEGHHVIARLQIDLSTGKSLMSLQPDPLPRIVALHFTGQAEFTPEQLAEIIPKDVKEQGYTDRSFHQAVELNLRRAYEDHGMYRVRFPAISSQPQPGWAVSVATSIEEGAKYTLGDVQIAGDNLPIDAMLKAANFRKNEIANWSQIQRSIWELEKPVKRLGYLNAAAVPEGVFHDDQHILDIKLSIRTGPLFRFGQLQIAGLPPNLEAQARKIWSLNPGDPFDYDYPRDFFPAFFRSVDSRQFKKYNVSMQKGSGQNVIDFALTFDPR